MTLDDWMHFGWGVGAALAVGMIFRMIIGTRLNLFLINSDSSILDQSLIPISSMSRKRHSFWRTLRDRTWREDIRITLADYRDGTADFHIKYGLWRRYQLALEKRGKTEVKLGKRVLVEGRSYPLRTGMKILVGDRAFTVVVSLSRAPSAGTGIADEAA
jgi:hypothetical protein